MRLRGRRLTMVLTIVLVIVLGGGVTAAWAVGRTQSNPAPADYAAGPSGDHTVRLAGDAVNHPRAAAVRQTLQRYFDSINQRDYGAWVDAVAVDQSADQSQAEWVRQYSTTLDSNLEVATIADEPLRARLMFTSEQAVEFAPKRLPATCINWDLTYLLEERDGDLVLSGLDPTAQSMTACG
jgi:hypothetical protein